MVDLVLIASESLDDGRLTSRCALSWCAKAIATNTIRSLTRKAPLSGEAGTQRAITALTTNPMHQVRAGDVAALVVPESSDLNPCRSPSVKRRTDSYGVWPSF